MALSYYNAIVSDDIAYSIDMVTLRGSYRPHVLDPDLPFSVSRPFLDVFVDCFRYFRPPEGWEHQHYDSFSFLSYRDMWVLTLADGSVAKFFFGFRGYDSSMETAWKIQFNPNKCASCDALIRLVKWVISVSGDCRISGIDCAADMPVSRSLAFLVKDKRKYQLVFNSAEDKTEYLGCRGQSGFVKLYNKRLESNLDYDLTRFELSIDLSDGTILFNTDCLSKFIPSVYLLKSQLDMDALSLSASDSVLLRFCLEHPDGLSLLDKRKRKTIRAAFDLVCVPVQFDLLIWIRQYYFLRELFF